MRIVPLQEEHVPALARLVGAHLRMIRYPFDASTPVLRQRAALALGNDGLYAERRRWMVWGALDGDRLVGAARAYAVDRGQPALKPEDEQVPADLTWLLFEPDQPAVGQALLQTALDWIGPDPDGVQAFGLGSGLGWGGGGAPGQWLHVNAVLAGRAFEWVETSYLMWSIGSTAFSGPVNQDVRMTLDLLSDGSWQFWARLGGDIVGELLVKRMDDPTGWQPTWPSGRWLDWIHVQEAHQKRGIAAALVAAFADRARVSGIKYIAGLTRYEAALRLNERLGLKNRIPLRRYALPD